jgi:hypothetical protein
MNKKILINVVFLSVGLFGWVVSLSSIFKTGLGWDSVFDLSAAKIALENSRALNLESYYDLIPITSEFYGTFIYKISDWLSIQIIGDSIFGDVNNLNSYYLIDVTTLFISLLSILVVSFCLFLTFESSQYSFIFFGLISTLPIWVGMSQVNSKDIPVAAGISMLSSGFMLILKQNRSRNLFNAGILFTSLGAGLAISVRPASITIVLIFLLINTLIFLLFNIRSLKLRVLALDVLSIYLFTLVISFFILYLSNPIKSTNLVKWIIDSVQVSLNYPSIQQVRVFGQDFASNELPHWYVIAWVWAQLPVLTFVSLILGTILLVKKIVVNRDFYSLYSISPFMVQAFFVPAALLITQNNMYNGVRHILFIYPALIILSTIFLVKCIENFNSRILRVIGLNFVFLVLLLNAFASYRWAPYSYAYINPLAGMGSERKWDLDYWGLSSREGIEKLNFLNSSTSKYIMPDHSSSIPFGGKGVTKLSSIETPFSLYVFVHWNHKIVEDNCKIDFRIKRDNQVLGMGGNCS